MSEKLGIAIYGNRRQQTNGEELRRFVNSLILAGADVSMHEKLYDHLVYELDQKLPGVERVSECRADVSLAISIGGDGTFLRTVAWIESLEVPVLGINTGHLGFLTALNLSEALMAVDRICALDFRREHLSMLHVEAEGIKGSPLALNEVVVAKEDSASMISADVRINGHVLAEYKADGLIVATPTGSTAYNLSVGGPIVEPTAPVWVLSPIAAHSLTLRPLVVGDDSYLEISVKGRGNRFRLVIDGRQTSLPLGSKVAVRRARGKVVVLQRHDRDFAAILGEKLMFNE